MIVVFVTFLFLLILSAVFTARYIYVMVKLDAASRGMKNPTLWGLLSIGGSSNGGLLLYLLLRGRYPQNMEESQKPLFEQSRKRAVASIAVMAVSACMMCILGIVLCGSTL